MQKKHFARAFRRRYQNLHMASQSKDIGPWIGKKNLGDRGNSKSTLENIDITMYEYLV